MSLTDIRPLRRRRAVHGGLPRRLAPGQRVGRLRRAGHRPGGLEGILGLGELEEAVLLKRRPAPASRLLRRLPLLLLLQLLPAPPVEEGAPVVARTDSSWP